MEEEKIEFWNQKKVLEFLDMTRETLNKLVDKNILSEHVVNYKKFYNPKEINQLLIDSKKSDRDLKKYKLYIESQTKPLYTEMDKDLSKREQKFILETSLKFILSIESLMNYSKSRYNYFPDEDKLILKKCLEENGDFEKVAISFNKSRSFIRDRFNKIINLLNRSQSYVRDIFNSQEKTLEQIKKENEFLKAENKNLKISVSQNKNPDIDVKYFSDVIKIIDVSFLNENFKQKIIDNKDFFLKPIESIYKELSVRTSNGLRHPINRDYINDKVYNFDDDGWLYTKTIGDVFYLLECDINLLIGIRNFGKKSLNELKYFFEDSLGYDL